MPTINTMIGGQWVNLNTPIVRESTTPLDSYPIGSIYLSINNTNPAEIFGGTWEQIEGRFLLGAGYYSETISGTTYNYTYTAGTSGGEAEHTLTVDEMPGHTHKITVRAWGGTGNVYYEPSESSAAGTIEAYSSSAAGGDQPHNNMPPYLVVYMWQRVEDSSGPVIDSNTTSYD